VDQKAAMSILFKNEHDGLIASKQFSGKRVKRNGEGL
jgi:hypothetical protein